ncbi:hypothetical protein [Pseudonocardia endophytica]|uniref:Uncharacterized protein n=1 Tax=Pseudonocardia endophytica TaxID=401976 RepID=A0A4R1I188_PSEEN|nr:hypothetical protein [Pseudonocardia endophytica]TCK27305.1 hypothetical protein EV378_3173 [Pseudonocardia endophytica]
MDISRRTATTRPTIGTSGRHALGAAVGAVGFVVALWLLAGAFDVTSPDPGPATALPALLTLGGGAALGAVLLAGRRISPAAPLTSGLLWAVGALLTLNEPDLSSASILPAVGYQLGLAMAAMMLLGTLAVQPTRPRPQSRPQPLMTTLDGDTDWNLPAVRPVVAPREVPRRRPDGGGPRHRAAPGAPRVPTLATRRAAPDPRRMPPRRAGAIRPAGPMTPRRQWG